MFLRYAHRTEVEPRPTLGSNEEGVEWKARYLEKPSGPDLRLSYISVGYVVRYPDPRKTDAEVW